MASKSYEIVDKEQKELLPLPEARELLDIVCLVNMLIRNLGNLSRSAEELGIGRRTLYDLMEKYGISCSNGTLSIELTQLLSHVRLDVPRLEGYLSVLKP